MEGTEAAATAATVGSFFAPSPPREKQQDSNAGIEGSFLQQLGMQSIFDVLQGQEGAEQQQQQQQQLQQGQQQLQGMPSLDSSANVQFFLEELGKTFLRSGSLDQAGLGLCTPGGMANESGMLTPPAQRPGPPGTRTSAGKELLDILSAQVGANIAANLGAAGKDASLEELMASGQISAETLLGLIESLKAILPQDQPHNPTQQQQSLAALAEILGLSQGETKGMPEAKGPGTQAGGHLAGGGGQAVVATSAGLALPPTGSYSAPNTPATRSNLGPSVLGPGGGAAFALGGAGGGAGNQRQPSSLRNRRGLPDLPVHRPGVRPPMPSSQMSPLSGKRMANGPPMQPGGWPLSPVSKSPRAEGHMSPGGCQLGIQGSKLANGLGSYPASPTASLLGDMSRLAVHRPQTPTTSGLAPTASGGMSSAGPPGVGGPMGGSAGGAGDSGAVKPEPCLGLQAVPAGAGDGEGGGPKDPEGGEDAGAVGGSGQNAGALEVFESGDDFGVGHDFGEGDVGSGEGGSPGMSNRPKHSTKPRSVAERLRRERIAVRLQKLKEVMPKTDARIDTSAMLEDAVVYIRSLQSRCRALEKQNEMLQAQVARLSQQQNSMGGPMNPLMRPMGP